VFVDNETEPGNRASQPQVRSSKRSSIQHPNLLASLNLLEIRIRSVCYAFAIPPRKGLPAAVTVFCQTVPVCGSCQPRAVSPYRRIKRHKSPTNRATWN
jgi:hypothetical protein